MLARSILMFFAVFLNTTLASASSSYSYDLLISATDGQFLDSDVAPFPDVSGMIQSAPGDRMANASALADCGLVSVGGGAHGTGPRVSSFQALTNPRSQFYDEITIPAPVPGMLATGTVVARIDFFGFPVATSAAPSADFLAHGSYGLGASVGNCGAPCGYGLSGSWNFVNGQTVFNGDPIASFQTSPTLFGYDVPLPISLDLGFEAYATPALTAEVVTAGGTFGAQLSIVEVRDDQGNLITPPIHSDAGCQYVPEAFSPALGAGMLATLVSMRRGRHRIVRFGFKRR